MDDKEINVMKAMLDIDQYLIFWAPDSKTIKQVNKILPVKDELDEECAIFNNGIFNDGYALLSNCKFSDFIFGQRFQELTKIKDF